MIMSVFLMIIVPVVLMEASMVVWLLMNIMTVKSSMKRINHNWCACEMIMRIICEMVVIVTMTVPVVVIIFMPICVRIVWICVVGKKSLIVVLNAVLGLMFYFVEQLIVFMFNIFFDLYSMVEFDIMRIEGVVMVIMSVMIDAFVISFPVSVVTVVVAVGVMSGNWLMDSVVSVEMRVMLNAMDVMVCVMSWMESMGVRVVVE